MAVKGVQGRGVLIDLYKHFGLERKLVGYSDLRRIMESDKIVIESGDMVCLHTGFANMLLEMKGRPDPDKLHTSCAVLDGHDEALQNWIMESGLSVLISDNYAVEAVPAREKIGSTINAPLHELCIFKLGIHLGELWYLTDLCRWLQQRERYRFLLTAPPLRLPGAAGSPLTPIATV